MTTTRNEAAERLQEQLLREYRMTDADKKAMVRDALAAERRATVERIRERLQEAWSQEAALAILDEEAAR
jgi:hypothetical protein